MQPSADSTVMGEAATTRSGGLLPIHTKFAGESFDADSNVRIVYAGSPEDTIKRESRIIILIGRKDDEYSTCLLIDFICNLFYGVEFDSPHRLKIANEVFKAACRPHFIHKILVLRPPDIAAEAGDEHNILSHYLTGGDLGDLLSQYFPGNLRFHSIALMLSARRVQSLLLLSPLGGDKPGRSTTLPRPDGIERLFERQFAILVMGSVSGEKESNRIIIAASLNVHDGAITPAVLCSQISNIERLFLAADRRCDGRMLKLHFNASELFSKPSENQFRRGQQEHYWKVAEENLRKYFRLLHHSDVDCQLLSAFVVALRRSSSVESAMSSPLINCLDRTTAAGVDRTMPLSPDSAIASLGGGSLRATDSPNKENVAMRESRNSLTSADVRNERPALSPVFSSTVNEQRSKNVDEQSEKHSNTPSAQSTTIWSSSSPSVRFGVSMPETLGIHGTRVLISESAPPLIVLPPPKTKRAAKTGSERDVIVCEQDTRYIVKEVELLTMSRFTGVSQHAPSPPSKNVFKKSTNFPENVTSAPRKRRPSGVDGGNTALSYEQEEAATTSDEKTDVEVLRRYVFDPLTNSYKMRYVREVKVRRANDHQVVGDSVEAKDFYPLQTSNSFSDFGALAKQDDFRSAGGDRPRNKSGQSNSSAVIRQRPSPMTDFRQQSFQRLTSERESIYDIYCRDYELKQSSTPNLLLSKSQESLGFSGKETRRTFERSSASRRPLSSGAGGAAKGARQRIAKQQQNQQQASSSAGQSDESNVTNAALPPVINLPPQKQSRIGSKQGPRIISADRSGTTANASKLLPDFPKDVLKDMLKPLGATDHLQKSTSPTEQSTPISDGTSGKTGITSPKNQWTLPAIPQAPLADAEVYQSVVSESQRAPLLIHGVGEATAKRWSKNPNRFGGLFDGQSLGDDDPERGSKKTNKKKANNTLRNCCYYLFIPLLIAAILAIFVAGVWKFLL